MGTMEEPPMAIQRNPNDPYRENLADDPFLAMPGDQLRRQARLDNELQADPELAEGPSNGGKIALFALGIAVLLGAVFYGLNNSSMRQSATSSTAQTAAPTTAQNTAAPTSPPAAPPGMRDVTPRSNSGSGVTTGAAPPAPPPASVDPANNMPARK